MNAVQDTLLHTLYQEVTADSSVSWGNTSAVCVRDALGQIRVHPQSALGSASLVDLLRTLDAVAAFKTQSTYVHKILSYSPLDTHNVFLDSGVSIPIVDASSLVPEMRDVTNAAIIRNEESLILWSYSACTVAYEYRELSHRLQHYVGECFCENIVQRMVLYPCMSLSAFSRLDFDIDFNMFPDFEFDFVAPPINLPSLDGLGHINGLANKKPQSTSVHPSVALSPDSARKKRKSRHEFVPDALSSPSARHSFLGYSQVFTLDASPRTLTLSEISPPPRTLVFEEGTSHDLSQSYVAEDEGDLSFYEENDISLGSQASSSACAISDDEDDHTDSGYSFRYTQPTYGKCKPDGEQSWRARGARTSSPSTSNVAPSERYQSETPKPSPPKRHILPLPTRRSSRHTTATPSTPALSPSSVVELPISVTPAPQVPESEKVQSSNIGSIVPSLSIDSQEVVSAGVNASSSASSASSDVGMEIDDPRDDAENEEEEDEYTAMSDDDDDDEEPMTSTSSARAKASSLSRPAPKRRRRRSGSSSQKKRQKYACEFCEKTFTREADSRRHSKSSCKASPHIHWYDCDHCDNKFNRDDALKRHIRTKHRDLGLL